ncbi:MAG: gamma-glutamyltransferase [Acidobacteria bacterium]|jgi:gamma-glutamyltranspeptidase/glutathione hydrolase|nr:gamma-glutamyltransferase [Acidobacteriota bacterium]|tara:strand:- start:2013 stop:3686 length:1674 start_codon:yes stop_codon:yes gene_type:complete
MAALGVLLLAITPVLLIGSAQPIRARRAMVVSQDDIASRVGVAIMRDGGNAMDAAVATALALAVTYPTAGNIGGGGFLIYRPVEGPPVAYDFRETAPGGSFPAMFVRDGEYDPVIHHNSHLAVGVPGTVAGLHLAWSEHGVLPWRRLVEPAVALAGDGFAMSDVLARSLAGVLPRMADYPASVAQFSKQGEPYQAGETFRQPDLALTLTRIAERGPAGFYEGETAELIEREMAANGGLMTRADLAAYRAVRRRPITGTYRGYEIISMPPVSSGGAAVIQILNILEGYDLSASGAGSAATTHLIIEAMRRAYADRARYLGDPAFNPSLPLDHLTSKDYAEELRETIREERASVSSSDSFVWPTEGLETTHVSVVDGARNAVSMTYTLEQGYGSKITVPGAGFLLNNEMGDFNGAPGLTTERGLIGTEPNLAEPGKRMLSSMTPTIVAQDGRFVMATGSPGGRSIINTVLLTILNVVDFRMNIQEAVDAPRLHHQWLPDETRYERWGLSPDTLALLSSMGHTMVETRVQGAVSAIFYNARENVLEAAEDRRRASAAVGF